MVKTTISRLVFLLFGCVAFILPAAAQKQPDVVRHCLNLMETQQFDRLQTAATQLLRQARNTGDRQRREAFAHVFLASTCMGQDGPTAERTMDAQLTAAKQLGQDIHNDTVLALAYNLNGILEAERRGNNYLAKVYFVKAHRYAANSHASRLQGKVALNLAKLGTRLDDATCAPYADEAYRWAASSDNRYYEFLATQYKAFYLTLARRYADAATYIESADSLQRTCKLKTDEAFHNLQADIYVNLGRYDRAWQVLQAIDDADGLAKPVQADYLYNMARLRQAGKSYTNSNQWLNQGLLAAAQAAYGGERGRYLEMMAQNYEQLGDTARALMVQKELSRYNDSLRNSEKMEAVSQIEMAMKEQEHGTQGKGSSALYWILALLVGAFGLSAFVIGWLKKRKKADETADFRPEKRGPQIDTEKENELFARLQKLMEDEKIYCDSDLTRDTLAERMGTNRTYLSQIIQKRTGLSFNQFVNGYRITEAKRILDNDTDKTYPLKAVCADVGFKSRTTFDKVFAEAAGCSPAEYRRKQPDRN